jgi:hypothetical protein
VKINYYTIAYHLVASYNTCTQFGFSEAEDITLIVSNFLGTYIWYTYKISLLLFEISVTGA